MTAPQSSAPELADIQLGDNGWIQALHRWADPGRFARLGALWSDHLDL